MPHINTIIQDLGILLLAAGVAGIICKRLGLSVVVGFLVAGIIIGPHSPPFSLIQDEGRIKDLSEVGLVFVMFSIGLELSLSRLAKMGIATLAATALGAFFMLQFTLLLGWLLNWSTMTGLFVAAMLMVSSSAVISKIMHELKLNHDRVAQMALAITVVEDVVAVIMLTVLGAHGKIPVEGSHENGLGGVLAVLGAFVALLIMGGLLLVPRVLRKLEKKNDPEIQTVIVIGLLLLCAFLTVKAGYSLALGAFLFGAVVSEIKQKIAIEQDFGGLKYVFSSVFFVSIGMLIDLKMLEDVWLSVLLLGIFSLIVRPVACGFALVLVGVPQKEARRGGLLLTPLGEFTFIIAQTGITAQILDKSFYPLAVGLSILTVLATPMLNRFSAPILRFMEWSEPKFVTRAVTAYHKWLHHVQARPAPPIMWRLLRGRLVTLAIEILFISGILIFSGRVLTVIEGAGFAATWNHDTLAYVFWSAIGVIVLIPLVAVWRNISAMSMIAGEGLGGRHTTSHKALQSRVITGAIRALAAVGLGYWLYAILPLKTLPGWGWALIGLVAVAVIIFFSNKLIYWHSQWETSVAQVLAEDSRGPEQVRAEARVVLDRSLEEWDMCLDDCKVPLGAACEGKTLAELAIPARFGCSILEMERNGYVITVTDSSMRLCPGDKLLLLGKTNQIKTACAYLSTKSSDEAAVPTALIGTYENESGDKIFGGSVLETFVMPECALSGKTLAEMKIPQSTGVRIAGLRRAGEQIINPMGDARLFAGDSLLVVGTIAELRVFRMWLSTQQLSPQL